MTIRQLANEKILILDGAIGTMIQGYDLPESDFWTEEIRQSMPLLKRKGLQMKSNNDVLNLSRPDVVLDIHRKYVLAGSELIETNTFSSQRISQADYHLEGFAREMALQGARLARQAVDECPADGKPRFVLGSVGPTNKTCSMSPEVSDPAARDLTYSQLSTLTWNRWMP